MSTKPHDSITLKWGTLKAWSIKTPAALDLLRQYGELGVSASAMAQADTPEQKDILCRLIDAADCESVYLDWDGVDVPKEQAKEYIRTYRQR